MSSPRSAAFFGALAGAVLVGALGVLLAVTGAIDVDTEPARTTVATTTSEREAEAETDPQAESGDGASGAMNVADLYQRARPGVVDIQARGVRASPLQGGGRGTATGSGFVIDDDGNILTNDHVIDGARSVQVRFEGQRRPVDADVIGVDASTDLALLRVDPKDVKSGLAPLPLGTSADLRVGEPALALGSPFGLAGTVTTGIVSALDRDIPAPNGFTIDGVVQTDAAINPGNSGGPLLDGSGEVIGVNAQIATDGSRANSGVGFAIPIDVAKEILPGLEKDGKIERPWLGVSSGPRPSGGAGAVVARVVPASPAARAGLRPKDVIVEVDGKKVAEPQDIADTIEDMKPGDSVELTFRRDGDERTETVKLGTRPDEVDG